MHRRRMLWVAVCVVAALGSAPAAGQRSPSVRLAAARTFVVDSTGRVVPGTVGVVSSTLKMRALEREILLVFPRAQFTAGRADGRAVPVMVQFTLRYAGQRVEERWDSFCQLVTGR